MNDSPVIVEESADRVVLRLNRPEVRNAVNLAMVEALHDACNLLEATPRIALIIGNGDDFAAGADISQLAVRRTNEALAGINSGLFSRIARLPMPVIALVDGNALGGGAELAYAADFRIGTPRTRFGNPEPGLGILAAAGACWRLVELVGEPVAKEVLLAGRILDAQAAFDLHLVTEIVEAGDLEAAGHRLVDTISRSGALAIRLTKTVLQLPREAHPVVDDLAQAILFETEEKAERMQKFLDRRRK